jgi:DNA-binding transcriptional ArsR family regulator
LVARIATAPVGQSGNTASTLSPGSAQYDRAPATTTTKEQQMDLIDRIRKDIEGRLDAILGEADKLRKALQALDPRPGSRPAQTRTAPSRPNASRSTASAQPTRRRSSSTRRSAPGATKRRVLAALSDGNAKTAGEVASATGLKRGTVSTTLSKLAKTGEVVKAERGYRLPSAA